MKFVKKLLNLNTCYRKKRYDVVDPTKPSERFKSVLHTVGCHGEYEKLFDGVFENYLKVKFRDCYFESVIQNKALKYVNLMFLIFRFLMD